MNNTNEYELSENEEPRSTNTVLLGFGSNLGDRKSFIDCAVNHLINFSAITFLRLSSYYESEPIGFKDQPWFINSCLLAATTINAFDLLNAVKSTENRIGRMKRDKWHEREIDIDILLFGNEIIHLENLIIPHPEFHKRKFALLPSSEIAPEMLHPKLNLTVSELLAQCDDCSVVKKY